MNGTAGAVVSANKEQHLNGTKLDPECSTTVVTPDEPEGPGVGATSSSNRCALPYQEKAEAFYNHDAVQIAVAGLIMSNFLINIIKMQIDPAGLNHPGVFNAFDTFFNVVFMFELFINMYGHWFQVFWSSPWNWFDSLVVLIGVLDLVEADLPGPLRLLRLLRAFRVFRLFKRIRSLNKILVSLFHALPGMVHAFCINLLVMCIYAVLATECFRDIHFACDKSGSNTVPGAVTPREDCYGEDYYGTFLMSLYTLFQVLTGESWSEAVVRPLLHYYEYDVWSVAGSAFFFVTFILVNAIVLVNVVVAVLLDGMNTGAAEHEAEEKARNSVIEQEKIQLEKLELDPKDQMEEKEQLTEIKGCSSDDVCFPELRAEVAGLKKDLEQMALQLRTAFQEHLI